MTRDHIACCPKTPPLSVFICFDILSLLSLPREPALYIRYITSFFCPNKQPLSLSLSLSMRDNCAMSLLGAMDRLWFHQIILFPQPISLLFPRTLKTSPQGPEPISETLTYLSSNISQPPLLEEEISSAESPIIPSEDDSKNQRDDAKKEIKPKEGPTRLNLITSKSQSRSSSPLNRIHPKRLRSYSGAVRRLQKTMSCKTLPELELEEVKGFMDLGFKFSKEHLSPRMIQVLPGLQRLADGEEVAKDNQEMVEEEEEEEDEEEEEERGVMRPYLSEAWLIKRPDSSLLNLRLPRVSTAAEMKKHLRFWARTVASVIQQES